MRKEAIWLMIKTEHGSREYSSAWQCLSGKYKVLSSTPVLVKKKKRRGTRRQKIWILYLVKNTRRLHFWYVHRIIFFKNYLISICMWYLVKMFIVGNWWIHTTHMYPFHIPLNPCFVPLPTICWPMFIWKDLRLEW